MKSKPDKSYDLAIVDPPYGMMGNGFSPTAKLKRIDGGKGSGTLSNSNCKFPKIDMKYPGGFQTKLGGKPQKEYFEELFRVSKNQIIWGMQYFIKYIHPHQCVIIWDKINGESRFSDAELAWTSFDYWVRIIKQCPDRIGRIHPTQKPIKLYRKVLKKFAKQGDKILDTHGGSMTIARACEMEGFDLDICEIDKEYFEVGINAFNLQKQQMRLF